MAPRKREPTATEQIAALNERRHVNGGYIIPPDHDRSFRDWLHAVAEIGSPGDVEIAWHYNQNAHVKAQLINEYQALRNQAGARYGKLEAAAFIEFQRDRMEADKRSERARIQRRIESLRAEASNLEQQLERM